MGSVIPKSLGRVPEESNVLELSTTLPPALSRAKSNRAIWSAL